MHLLPFPYPLKVDWWAEVSGISDDLCLDVREERQLLLEYKQLEGSASKPHLQPPRTQEPFLGLFAWSDEQAARVWPAGSLRNDAPLLKTLSFGSGDHLLPHEPGVKWQERLPKLLQPAPSAAKQGGSQGIAGGIPWVGSSPEAPHEGVVLAGGAAVHMVLPGRSPPTDSDLFMVVPSRLGGELLSEEERLQRARQLLQRTLNRLHAAKHRLAAGGAKALHDYISVDPTSVTYLVLEKDAKEWDSDADLYTEAVHKVQIILRLYETPAQVVHGFDLDVSSVLYDGRELYATRRALRALHTRTMLVDPARQSPTYEHRLAKYALRYGLRVLVPGLLPEAVKAFDEQMEKDFDWFSSAIEESCKPEAEAEGAEEGAPARRRRKKKGKRWSPSQAVAAAQLFAIGRWREQRGLARLLLLEWVIRMEVEVQPGTFQRAVADPLDMLCRRRAATAWEQIAGPVSGDVYPSRAQLKQMMGRWVARTALCRSSHAYDHLAQDACVGRVVRFVAYQQNYAYSFPLPKRAHSQLQGLHFVTEGVQRQDLPVFSGSFQPTPANDWYGSALRYLEEPFCSAGMGIRERLERLLDDVVREAVNPSRKAPQEEQKAPDPTDVTRRTAVVGLFVGFVAGMAAELLFSPLRSARRR